MSLLKTQAVPLLSPLCRDGGRSLLRLFVQGREVPTLVLPSPRASSRPARPFVVAEALQTPVKALPFQSML